MSDFARAMIVFVSILGACVLGWYLGLRAQVKARRSTGEHFHTLGFGVSFPCSDERCPEMWDVP